MHVKFHFGFKTQFIANTIVIENLDIQGIEILRNGLLSKTRFSPKISKIYS